MSAPELDMNTVERILIQPTRLSIDQTEAVLSKARYNRVIAGAGAGKTETLTRRIAVIHEYEDRRQIHNNYIIAQHTSSC